MLYDITTFARYPFLAMQQKFLFNARSMSKMPIMVKAMFAQETFNQANTITRAASMNLQKQNFIGASLVRVM
jgi:hypothetical protein